MFSDCLAAYANTDCSHGTDKNTTHSYGEIYNPIFAAICERPAPIKVLEIGIYSGASLLAMADYMPHAEIYGVDITLRHVKFGKNHPRIHMYEMDGTDEKTAEHIGQQFDLIIEDGSHLPEHQIKSLQVFGPRLAPGGVYIMEDIDGNTVAFLRPTLEKIATNLNLSMEWIDLQQKKGRYDDILAVFRRMDC